MMMMMNLQKTSPKQGKPTNASAIHVSLDVAIGAGLQATKVNR